MKKFVKILGKLCVWSFKINLRQFLKNFQKIIEHFDEFRVRAENFEIKIYWNFETGEWLSWGKSW